MKQALRGWSGQHWMACALAGALSLGAASATERFFTYTYEPEVFPKGASEFEQWVTWAGDRNSAVGQDNYSRWEMREEFEYGVTDNYSASLYWNTAVESFRDPVTHRGFSSHDLLDFSVENRYMLLNPADHAVGLTLYAEPRFSDHDVEMEEKIILGQRCGDWKWALNLSHATDWSLLNGGGTEGEVEVDFGLTRMFGHHWAVGFELADNNEIPEYSQWENTAVYLGPAVSYRAERWWATLSVLPQIYGQNFLGNPDRVSNLDLQGHERVNVRLIAGIAF